MNAQNIVQGVQKENNSAKWSNELEQAIVRILIGIVLVFYLWYVSKHHDVSYLNFHNKFFIVIAVFLLLSTIVIFSVLQKPGKVPARRVAAIFLDVGSLSYLFFAFENAAAPLYCIYLWIIIGYGFRFGKKYLLIAMTVSLISFGSVIYFIPFWSIHLNLSIGLWLGMLLISLYLNTLVGRLCRALDHAEVANHAKRQFISSVSHELRTPLNAIIGMVDLLKGTNLDRDQEEMLDCMNKTSHVMLSQIEDVLDFSKIEAGKMAIEETDFDLYALVFGVIDIFRFHIEPGTVEMLIHIDCDVPHSLQGDPHHLRQIIVNLLGNAVKFTSQGQIVIRIRKLEKHDSAVRLRFSITDTGVGIAYEAQSRIFESFTQADNSTARRYGGTGLGTTICQQLVELMHGRIGFHSEPGIGSEFWFELEFISQSKTVNNYQSQKSVFYQSMIINLDEKYDARIEKIIAFFDQKIRCVNDLGTAASKIEHSCLSGKPIRLIFLLMSPSNGGRRVDYEEKLRKIIGVLKSVSGYLPLSLILICPESLAEEEAGELALQTGFTSLLKNPIDKNILQNILHAHLSMLQNSIAKKKSLTEERGTLQPTTVLCRESDAANSHHILIAEDNHTNRMVLQKILERAQYRCSVASDGEEALNLLEKNYFDAIVLDMNMPIMSGLEVARTYRVMRRHTMRAPMIMFSANATTDAKNRSMQAGVDVFLPKPIQIESFLKTLDELIRKYKSSNFPEQIIVNARLTKECKWLHYDEPVLNLCVMEDLEKISNDPYFLDQLIGEFIFENKKIMLRFGAAICHTDHEQVKDILHSLKGSAVSVGGRSLLMLCRQIEKMQDHELEGFADEIMEVVGSACDVLCKELENYRKKRVKCRPENLCHI